MFGLGKDAVFEEDARRIREDNEALRDNLTALKSAAGTGSDQAHLFDMGAAGIGTLHEVITTLMACVDALSARVAILENQ